MTINEQKEELLKKFENLANEISLRNGDEAIPLSEAPEDVKEWLNRIADFIISERNLMATQDNKIPLLKPPLGVTPLAIHRDKRIIELSRAIMEYTECGTRDSLLDWGLELYETLQNKHKDQNMSWRH